MKLQNMLSLFIWKQCSLSLSFLLYCNVKNITSNGIVSGLSHFFIQIQKGHKSRITILKPELAWMWHSFSNMHVVVQTFTLQLFKVFLREFVCAYIGLLANTVVRPTKNINFYSVSNHTSYKRTAGWLRDWWGLEL